VARGGGAHANGGDCPAFSLSVGVKVVEVAHQRPKLFIIRHLFAHIISLKAIPGVNLGPVIAATSLRFNLVTAIPDDSDGARAVLSR
jgi:hypothetical protein